MKERTTTITVLVICLLLCITNVTTVAINKRQGDKINSIEKKIEEIRTENVDYANKVENLEKQLNKLENEITGIKEQTDKIADKLVEIDSRENAQEELKAAKEETTEEVTTEYVPERAIIIEAPTTEEATEE